MKINETSNNSFQNKVLIDTFIEQISALQTDVGNLQIADDNLAQAIAAKANSADIANAVSTGSLTTPTANIANLTVPGSATVENTIIDTAAIDTEVVTTSTITNLHAMDEIAGTVRTGTLTVDNDAAISGDLTVQDINARDIVSGSVNTLNLTAAEADINKLEAQNAEVTNKLTVNDLEVSGEFTGVSHIETDEIETDSITTDDAEVETLKVEKIRDWVSQVMNSEYEITPTPQLGNTDTYTIELPLFDGVFLLSWEDSTNVIWSATVIGNGKTYGVSWGSRTDTNYITDIFNYNGKVYIRVNSNGRLKYAYSATQELSQITIYYNMVGWTSDKSLEQLCDENNHLQNVYPFGMIWFGPVYIPRLIRDAENGALNFKGSCELSELPNLIDANVGDVWNITDYGYTNNNFVEGSGKPVNIGDDVVAVEVEETVLEKDSSIVGWGLANIAQADNGQILLGATSSTVEFFIGTFNNFVQSNYVLQQFFKCSNGRLLGYSNNNDGQRVYYSDDNGETWTQSTGSKKYINEYIKFTENNGRLFFGKNYSDDNGETWQTLNISNYNENISYLPLYNDTILAIAPYYVFKSTDNGDTWESISHFEESTPKSAIYKNGTILVLKMYGLYKSTDEGLTWSQAGIRDSINRIVEIDDKVLLLENSGVYETTDMGDTKVPFNTEVASVNDMIKIGNAYYFASSNGFYKYAEGQKLIKWDKFAAGVNYENFIAERITATTALKSEGTLEVDGDAQFDEDIELTKANAAITENGIAITNTGNKVESVTGNVTESVTGTKTVNLTAGETINGSVSLIGDLDQTGDQDITGSVEISEKETINELTPEDSGYTVDHDYWTLDTDTVITNIGETVSSPLGTELSRTLLETPDLAIGNNILYCTQKATSMLSTYHICTLNNTEIIFEQQGTQRVITDFDPRRHPEGYMPGRTFGPYSKAIFTRRDETTLESRTLYYRIDTNYWLNYNRGSIEVTDPAMINELNSRVGYRLNIQDYNNFNWHQVTLSANGYTKSDVPISRTVPYTEATHKVYYTPYQETIQGIDENHQYTPADEVLTVNGSEKISRDLKVQGWIYQEDYRRAILPNINANTINSNGGTLVIGELE